VFSRETANQLQQAKDQIKEQVYSLENIVKKGMSIIISSDNCYFVIHVQSKLH
jgi:hypothetical protein